MPLYPDQVEFKNNLGRELGRYDHIIACAATGFGKTVVFVDIADGYRAKQPDNVVMILTESIKIYDQIAGEMAGRIIDINSDEKDVFIPTETGAIIVAMSQTLYRRTTLLERLKAMGRRLLLIIDEGHVGTQNNVIRELPEAKKICFTATPDARWAKHLPEFYKSIVVGPQPEELVRLGRLSPYKHFARVSADLGRLTVKGGEFTEESQEQAFGTAQVFDGLVEDLRTITYQKALIFCASIKDAEMEYERLTNAGFECSRVHTNRKILSEAEEAYQIGQFISGSAKICISVGTMTKGFDYPPVDLVIIRRATKSLPLYLQMLGRGSRIWEPGSRKFDPSLHTAKTGWIALDYGQNFMRFGLWDMDRDWDDVWNKPSKPKDGVAPVKMCPQCDYIMKNQESVCPNCGFEFVKNVKEMEPGKLIEVTAAYSAMIGRKMSQLSPNELAIYANFKNKKSFAARIAKSLDQSTVGYLDNYAKCMGYKSTWCDFIRRQIEKDESGNPIKVEFNDFAIR